MPCSDFRYPTTAMCFSRPQPAMICCHSAIERPYFFSMDGKYDAGPCFGHGGACSAMLTCSSRRLRQMMRRAGRTDLIARRRDSPVSVGAGQADDRDGAVGFLLVAGVAWLGLGDPLPGLRACVPVELRGGHPHVTAAEVDPDLVGMRGDVVVPGRMTSRSTRRGNHQPGIVAVREPGHGRLPLLAGLGPDRGQVQQIHALELVPGPAMPAHRDPVEGAGHGIRRRDPAAAAPARSLLEAHYVLPTWSHAEIEGVLAIPILPPRGWDGWPRRRRQQVLSSPGP